MKDTGLSKLLVALIGVPGLTICLLAWMQPLDMPERVMSTTIGATGLAWALIRANSLKSTSLKVRVGARENGTEKTSLD